MLRTDNVQHLKTEGCSIIYMSNNDADGRALGTIHALVVPQDVCRAEICVGIARVTVLAAVAADELQLQRARLNLAVVTIADAMIDGDRRISS